jgi:hypothetical protein
LGEGVSLIQVVPQLPPAIGGVAGFATTLARALAEAGGAPSFFLVAARAWRTTDELPAAAIGEQSAANLERQLTSTGASTVLVHYANYAYQRRGCPSWLVEGAQRWRRASPGRRLVSFFHELYATGPPWRSSFWLSPAQRRLAARMLRASDGAATSLALYGRRLARWSPGAEPLVAPVFSTVGEPAAVPPSAEREPRTMVVFGGPGGRRRAYRELRPVLATACRALAVVEVLDLGPPLGELPAEIAGVPVRALGIRPEPEVSAILLRSYAGFLAYPEAFLPKSTAFAAYCAHGLVPVVAWPQQRRADPAAPERPPFWAPDVEPAPADPARLAARACAWYGGHDLTCQAAAIGALLGSAAPAAASAGPRRRTMP